MENEMEVRRREKKSREKRKVRKKRNVKELMKKGREEEKEIGREMW